MPTFTYSFTVEAPLTAVSDFHQSPTAFKQLTPFPIIPQIHKNEAMAEGSTTQFTLWFGPLPIHWTAVHSNVSHNGFTDTQTEGPLAKWVHTHTFTAVSETKTRIDEHIVYEYSGGIKSVLGRLLFNPSALYFLFTARKLLTRHHVKQYHPSMASL